MYMSQHNRTATGPAYVKRETLMLFTYSLVQNPLKSLDVFPSKAHMLIGIKRFCFLLYF